MYKLMAFNLEVIPKFPPKSTGGPKSWVGLNILNFRNKLCTKKRREGRKAFKAVEILAPKDFRIPLTSEVIGRAQLKRLDL